jgi:hypothetical protein
MHSECEQSVKDDKTYLINKWGIRLEFKKINPEVIAKRQEFYQVFDKYIPTPFADKRDLYLAECLMLEAMEGNGPRKDGSPAENHAYDVAIITIAELGAKNTGTVIKALIHDTIEDSQSGTKHLVTKKRINNLFGENIAESIDGLTKIKSSDYHEGQLLTHHKLFKLLESDPEAVAVKIADRMHFFRTSTVIPEKTKQLKARETLTYYAPLATGLGLHKAARELVQSSFRELGFPPRTKMHEARSAEYSIVVEKYNEFIRGLDAYWVDKTTSLSREPVLYDAYKAVEENLELLTDAWSPCYAAFVINTRIPGVDEKEPDEWMGKIYAISQHLVRVGLAPQSLLHDLHNLPPDPLISIRTDIYIGKVPVRLIFIRQSENQKRMATVFDIGRPDNPNLGEEALNKIEDLKQTYRVLRTREISQISQDDVLYCLRSGSTKMIDTDEGKVGISVDGTLLDSLYSLPQTRIHRMKVSGGFFVDEQKSRIKLSLGSDVPDKAKIEFSEQTSSQIKPEWLDMVKMPSSRRKIRAQLDLILKKELQKSNQTTIEEEMHRMVFNRGINIIKNLYQQVAIELHLPSINLKTDIRTTENFYWENEIKYPTSTGSERMDKYYNFILNIGLDAPGFQPDLGRTSLVWQVVEKLVRIQNERLNLRIGLIDSPGELYQLAGKFNEQGINIADIIEEPNFLYPDKSYVNIEISPQDLGKLENSGIEFK